MPRQNGFEVLAALERDPQLKCIPVVVLTTSSSPNHINRCYELGANAYLEKPLGINKEEGKTLLTAAKKAKKRIGCAPDTFMGAGLQTARKLIDDAPSIWAAYPKLIEVMRDDVQGYTYSPLNYSGIFSFYPISLRR